MELARRPAVLAAFAAAVLVLAVSVWVARSDDPAAPVVEDASGVASDGGTGDDGAAAGDGSDGDGGGGTADGSGDAAGAAGDGSAADDGAGTTEGAGGDTGEAADSGDASGDGAGATTLVLPTAGTYTYAASGQYQLTGGDPVVLPGVATAEVTVDGDRWSQQLRAGDDYADVFGFVLGADGLVWDTWDLVRTLNGAPGTTSYTCSGDPVHSASWNEGDVAQHGCETRGLASDGTIAHLGSEELALGDGSRTTVDHLRYDYTLSGSGVTGEGTLELWVDPATGLRVREKRSIRSVTNGTTEYREDVDVVLESLTPA